MGHCDETAVNYCQPILPIDNPVSHPLYVKTYIGLHTHRWELACYRKTGVKNRWRAEVGTCAMVGAVIGTAVYLPHSEFLPQYKIPHFLKFDSSKIPQVGVGTCVFAVF